MHLRREWLIGKRTLISSIQQSADLFDISQSVTAIDKNAVAILHLFGRKRRVDDPGDVNNARMLSKYPPATSQMMMERVMHQLEPSNPTHRSDCLHRFCLMAQGGGDKSQRLYEAHQFNRLQHRLDRRQRPRPRGTQLVYPIPSSLHRQKPHCLVPHRAPPLLATHLPPQCF